MVQLLVFNYKRGDEYAFIPLAVPVDVLEFSAIPLFLIEVPESASERSFPQRFPQQVEKPQRVKVLL